MHSAKHSLNLIILPLCARKTMDNYLAVCRLRSNINDKPVCLLKDISQQRRQMSSELCRGQDLAWLFVLSQPVLLPCNNRGMEADKNEHYLVTYVDLRRFTSTSHFGEHRCLG